MDLSKFALFRMAQTTMNWSAQRQKVLAQNVAHINTPDYRPKDLKELDFRRMATEAARPEPVRATMTHAAHQPGTREEPGQFAARESRRTFETTLDDNTVVLEEQMRKIGSTKSQFMLATNLFERNLRMLKTALGRQGG
ncbi:flagellar basal body rod protein FlgB [Roseospira navarrensis]|uniref:Flagellar basal body rod protein FlgB n=1 Tax=Roseospira navarrensis TaxID=140058 RepID=A0A7X1ZAZ5_9PROT|nr:flagellar biosynthesis protein FlgB [Roseospira navarrensis]MQX35225.1 flagellar biosynthesis protein FlgB [Roseospira navarrensis]